MRIEAVSKGIVVSTSAELDSNGLTGVARVIRERDRYAASTLKPGEILVTTMTNSAEEPNLLTARAIITERGGYTCHAALTANLFAIPCIVGAENITKLIETGDLLHLKASGDILVTRSKC